MSARPQMVRIVIAALVIGLAVIRLAFHEGLSGRMDSVFFIVIGAGLFLLLIPLQYLKSFKAGSLEFSLEQPQVQGAISGLNVDRIKNESIQTHLLRLKEELVSIRGSRVLWIDDYPHVVVGERRLLRALGVEVVTAISSDAALAILEADNDFDLIITDVQREGVSHQVTGGVPIHEGTNFIVALRSNHTDPVIKKLPVVFYAAYDLERLINFTASARALYPPPEISNSVEDLIPKVIQLLAHSRAKPIPGAKEKKASPARGRGYYSYSPATYEPPPYKPVSYPAVDSGSDYPAPPTYPRPSYEPVSYPAADSGSDYPTPPQEYPPGDSPVLHEDPDSGFEEEEHEEHEGTPQSPMEEKGRRA